MGELDDEVFELRLMSPAELRTEVTGLRAKLRAVRAALNNLISSIETDHGDGEEEALDGALDADLIHEDLKGIRDLLGPVDDEAAVTWDKLRDDPCSKCGGYSRKSTAGCDHCDHEEK